MLFFVARICALRKLWGIILRSPKASQLVPPCLIVSYIIGKLCIWHFWNSGGKSFVDHLWSARIFVTHPDRLVTLIQFLVLYHILLSGRCPLSDSLVTSHCTSCLSLKMLIIKIFIKIGTYVELDWMGRSTHPQLCNVKYVAALNWWDWDGLVGSLGINQV